jgi:hypothetical protein
MPKEWKLNEFDPTPNQCLGGGRVVKKKVIPIEGFYAV